MLPIRKSKIHRSITSSSLARLGNKLFTEYQLPPPTIVRMNILNNFTVIRISLPLGLPPLMVAPPPRVSPCLPWRH